MTPADLNHVLGNPAWTVAGVVFAAIAIGVPIFLYWRSRSRRQLTVKRNLTELVSIHDEALGKVTLNYEGEPVRNAYLLEVHLLNSGNVPLDKPDFVHSVEVILGGSARVMSAGFSDVSPRDLEPELDRGKDRVQLQPLLLNPGDEPTVKILVRDFSGKARIHARIVGVKGLTEERRQQWSGTRSKLRRFLSITGFDVIAAGLSVAVGAGVIITLISPIFQGHETAPLRHSLIQIRGHKSPICGDVEVIEANMTVIKTAKRHEIKSFPTAEITTIREHAC